MTLAFVSAGAAEGLVRALAAEQAVAIEGRFGAVGAMLEALDAGERADVVILTRAQVAVLAASARVLASSVSDLGTVATAIAVRAADKRPDISSADDLREALLAADAIHFPDPAKSTAGIHFTQVIERLGITEALAGRLRTHPNGRTAMRALAESGGNPIGCTQATEILATPGLTLVGSLPRGYSLDTVYTAAVDARSTNTQAGDFLRRLTGIEERARRHAAGFR